MKKFPNDAKAIDEHKEDEPLKAKPMELEGLTNGIGHQLGKDVKRMGIIRMICNYQ